ncbi:MAG: hypothetical protein ACKVZH_10510 [Blastocatellia bacterium]
MTKSIQTNLFGKSRTTCEVVRGCVRRFCRNRATSAGCPTTFEDAVIGWDANLESAALASLAKKRRHCFFHHHVSKPQRPLQKNFAETGIFSGSDFSLAQSRDAVRLAKQLRRELRAWTLALFPSSANCADGINAGVICSCKKRRARCGKIFLFFRLLGEKRRVV